MHWELRWSPQTQGDSCYYDQGRDTRLSLPNPFTNGVKRDCSFNFFFYMFIWRLMPIGYINFAVVPTLNLREWEYLWQLMRSNFPFWSPICAFDSTSPSLYNIKSPPLSGRGKILVEPWIYKWGSKWFVTVPDCMSVEIFKEWRSSSRIAKCESATRTNIPQ